MNYRIDYLLKFISNDMFNKIIRDKGEYLLTNLENNYVDVSLNIRYLIKYGIKDIDRVVYDRVEDLILSHNEFIDMVNRYEETLGKDGFIDMIENV